MVIIIVAFVSIFLAFHRRWNQKLERRRPSLWVFIRMLKDEQRLVGVTTRAAERGEARPPQRKKWRDMEESIGRLKREYSQGERTVEEYWNAVLHSVHNFV